MGKAEDIIKEFHSSQANELKQLKISLKDRLETIRALDAKILDELGDDKGIEEEIEEAGYFSERVLEIVAQIESVCLGKIKQKMEVIRHLNKGNEKLKLISTFNTLLQR